MPNTDTTTLIAQLRAVLAKVVGVAIDRMTGPIQAERVLLEVQLLDFGPWRHIRERHRRRSRRALVAATEQIKVALAEFLVALGARSVLAGTVDPRTTARVSTTRQSRRRSDVPRARADHSSTGSTLRAPLNVATTIGTRQARAITAIFEKFPMPSQTMNSGMSAGLGTG